MYAKRGNLVNADASGVKASTKHLESRLEVIQVTHFGITEKPTRDCVIGLLCNDVSFRVE